VKGKIKSKSNHVRKNGILYLKGGDLTEEMSTVKQKYKEFLLSDIYSEEFFGTKKVIHVVI
jgi:16S rRNA (guanine527-N7)-methyltransferase